MVYRFMLGGIMKRLSGMNQEELSQTLMEKISILKNNMAEWMCDN